MTLNYITSCLQMNVANPCVIHSDSKQMLKRMTERTKRRNNYRIIIPEIGFQLYEYM